MAHALVVDDEKNVQRTLSITLSRAGHVVDVANSGEEAIDKINKTLYDFVVTDLKMGEVDGLGVLTAVKERDPETEVILMSAHGSIGSAVQAMKDGAHDYLEKPFSPEELLHTVALCLERRDLKSEVRLLKRSLEDPNDPDLIVGESKALKRILEDTENYAKSDSTVLITGETGTGKDLLARTIKRQSLRNNRPFVTVNCATIPKALFESELFGHVKGAFSGALRNRKGLAHEAHRGTLFLDEIGEMPLDVQSQLLRFLESGEIRPLGQNSNVIVDVRVIAATNRDLKQLIDEKLFRSDLYYRLDVLSLHLPPLRERRDDVDAIVDRSLTRLSKRIGREKPKITKASLQKLRAYDWPGNIRELQNVIERAIMLARGGEILPEHLVRLGSGSSAGGSPGSEGGIGELLPLADIEKMHILAVLKNCSGNQRKSARILNISKSTLWRKLKEYGIDSSSDGA
ncbi:MAG: sigma-54 dependent transcriptional regulator [Planctomycetota bacterium]|nr:sigma-54 dependent transcriptional regulator [Planctomycetota bacterium]